MAWSCCWFSPLLGDVLSSSLRFSLNISKFQFHQESGRQSTSKWMWLIVIYLVLYIFATKKNVTIAWKNGFGLSVVCNLRSSYKYLFNLRSSVLFFGEERREKGRKKLKEKGKKDRLVTGYYVSVFRKKFVITRNKHFPISSHKRKSTCSYLFTNTIIIVIVTISIVLVAIIVVLVVVIIKAENCYYSCSADDSWFLRGSDMRNYLDLSL